VVTKAFRGGVPEVVIDRDGVRHVVTKAVPPAAGRLVLQVRAELEAALAAARRMLAGWR
jgi:hypothetical protein